MINAKIICDSLSPQGSRITTFELVFPRMILAEAKTHRILSGLHGEIEVLEDISLNSFKEGSKNSASSRAIPFSKMVKAVQDNPFIPIAWQKEHKGMQGTEYITDEYHINLLREDWLNARDSAIAHAMTLNGGFIIEGELIEGVTKQLCNRLLEPFMYHKVLLTATEFDNFFELRTPKYQFKGSEYFKSKKDCIAFYPEAESLSDLEWLQINKGQSEIHMMQLAECMWDAYNESVPKQLKAGEWHIPYGDTIPTKALYNMVSDNGTWSFLDTPLQEMQDVLIKISTAKCARTSYTTVGEDGKEIPYEKDIALHDSLIASGHMSPTEHIARAMSDDEYNYFVKGKGTPYFNKKDYGWCLNYRGFIQYRYLLQNQ